MFTRLILSYNENDCQLLFTVDGKKPARQRKPSQVSNKNICILSLGQIASLLRIPRIF